MSEVQGRVLNLFCELPHSMGTEDIGQALLELDLEVTGMREPPIARVQSPYGAGFSDEMLKDGIEDYRRFYVEFEPFASSDDVIAATKVVFSALERLSSPT